MGIEAYLNHGFTTDEVSPTSNGYTPVRTIHHLFTSFNQLPHVTESRRTIRIGEKRIFSPDMPQPMRNTASLAPILLKRDNPDDVMQALLLRKLEHNVHRLITAAVVDQNNLIPADMLARRIANVPLRRGTGHGSLARRGAPEMLIEIRHCLFQGRENAVFFVVGGEDDAQSHLGGLNASHVRGRERFVGVDVLLVQFALGDPAVVPARELLGRADAVGGMAGDVCLLGGEHGAGFRGDEVEEDEELGVQLVMGVFNL